MRILLQVSDTHFGTEVPLVVEGLERFVREQRPSVLLVTGDVTQRARSWQFRAARRFVDRLEVPHVLVIPGNHDIPLFDLWSRLVRPYAAHAAAFGAELEPELDLDDLLVLCSNTTRPWRHKNGELSSAQIERVARRLSRARPAQLRVVATHHPVCVIRDEDVVNRVRGAAPAISAWLEAGADLVLGGHIHLPYHRRLESGPHRAWAVQAGTAVSRRLRGSVPNSVNLLRHEAGVPRSVRLERWDFDGQLQRFTRAEQSELGPVVAGEVHTPG